MVRPEIKKEIEMWEDFYLTTSGRIAELQTCTSRHGVNWINELIDISQQWNVIAKTEIKKLRAYYGR